MRIFSQIVRLSLLGLAALEVAALSLAPRAAAADPPVVDLRLALAVDCSGSVSEDRFLLQRQGYAEAFRSPQVLAAIASGGSQGAIAVTMFQWTGPTQQREVFPWTVVKDQASALAVADAIEAGPRQIFGGGTSLSGAIDHAMALFASSPIASERRTIDISGDGSNNRGRPAEAARDEAVAAGVVINGLPILTVEPGLDIWYRDHVVGGLGSFMLTVQSTDNFAAAVERKLVQEISLAAPARKRAALQGTGVGPPPL